MAEENGFDVRTKVKEKEKRNPVQIKKEKEKREKKREFNVRTKVKEKEKRNVAILLNLAGVQARRRFFTPHFFPPTSPLFFKRWTHGSTDGRRMD